MIRWWGAKWSTYLGRIVKRSWAQQLRMLISMRDKTCLEIVNCFELVFPGEGTHPQFKKKLSY